MMLDYPDDIARILFKRMLGEKISNTEEQLLEIWLQKHEENEKLHHFLQDDDLLKADFLEYYHLKHSALTDFEAKFSNTPIRSINKRPGIRRKFAFAAAAASLIIVIASYLIFSAAERSATRQANNFLMDKTSQATREVVPPAVQRASISVEENKIIGLSQNSDVQISQDGSVLINEKEKTEKISTSSNQFYTLTTPRGGFYNLTLSDGSKVWLNAASVLKFPKKFDGSVRKIQLQGEAFFDVAQKANQPFIVETEKGNIQVLGTTFNLKIYDQDPMITSLISGSVKVLTGPEQQQRYKIIAPGQQAVVRGNDALIEVEKFNVNPAAWRQNIFSFNNLSIKQVLSELSRWYDVTIEYRNGAKSDAVFVGDLDRTLPLERLIPHLSSISGLNLELKNKTLIVTNK